MNFIIQLEADPEPISTHFANAFVFIDIYLVKLAIPGWRQKSPTPWNKAVGYGWEIA